MGIMGAGDPQPEYCTVSLRGGEGKCWIRYQGNSPCLECGYLGHASPPLTTRILTVHCVQPLLSITSCDALISRVETQNTYKVANEREPSQCRE